MQYFIGVQLDGSQHIEPLHNCIAVDNAKEGEQLVWSLFKCFISLSAYQTLKSQIIANIINIQIQASNLIKPMDDDFLNFFTFIMSSFFHIICVGIICNGRVVCSIYYALHPLSYNKFI